MIPRNIQTNEVLAAIAALSLRHRQNMADDARESRWEMLGYLKDWSVVKQALEGIKDVPFELSQLESADMPELATSVSMILNQWGVNHRRQDITTEMMKNIVDSIPVFKEVVKRWNIIANLPLSAELVE